MSFFGSAVKLIRNKASSEEANQVVTDANLELDFSKNYVKDPFSVMIIQPLSGYLIKFMRLLSFIVTGGAIGLLLSVIAVLIFMQFVSVENKFVSMLCESQMSQWFPNSDFSIKKAKVTWNSEIRAPEIDLNTFKLDDIAIPALTLQLDLGRSLKEHKVVWDTVSINNPKINIKLDDNLKNAYIDPNFRKENAKKATSESISILSGLEKVMNNFKSVKIQNADVSIEENGVVWNLNNAYFHHVVGDKLPNAVLFKMKLPGQNYFSDFNVMRVSVADTDKYVVSVDACNPKGLKDFLTKRNTPINNPIISSVLDNNLPISGTIHFDMKDKKVVSGDFDLVGGKGSIRIPARDIMSPNLGKAVDQASVVGTFTENGIDISSLSVNYKNSGIQLSGISIPMTEYHLMDIANIDGTLALSNVGVDEMSTLLPDNFSKSILPTFKHYMPGFKLDLFKVDMNGSIAFGKRNIEEPLTFGNGNFKISNAKIPLGKSVVRDIDAVGVINKDGFDIKLSKAKLNSTLVNSGTFFVSSIDDSWIGSINAAVSIKDIKQYMKEVSHKLASLPIDQLNIADAADVNMKLVKVKGDNLRNKELPFRIVEGSGVLKSKDNTKDLKFSWNDKELVLAGNVNEGKNDIALSLEESLNQKTGVAEFKFRSDSNFLKTWLPDVANIFSEDYLLTLKTGWEGDVTQYQIEADLKNATLNLPIIGDAKLKSSDGYLKANVLCKDGFVDINDLDIKAGANRIKGNVVLGKDKSIYKCTFTEFDCNSNSAKINLFKNNDGKLSFSIIGSRFNADIIKNMIMPLSDKTTVSVYVNLDEMMISEARTMKNVKGSFDIKNNKIVNGACFGVFGKDTTLALNAQPNPNQPDESLISVSASNAEEFLKYFNITNTIKGGNIKIVMKNSVMPGSAISGAYEITDFIAKNEQLSRLISFSSLTTLPGAEEYTVGFNACSGSFVYNGDTVTIGNGRAMGPTVGISYSGKYDRINDELELSGVSLLTSSVLNSRGLRGAYGAPYLLKGPFERATLSIKPVQFMTNESIQEIFGDLMPIVVDADSYNSYRNIAPVKSSMSDPFSKNAFDQVVEQKVVTEQQPKTERKFGVRINRR
ncbi:MAG: hypothetical protein IJA14_04115 [Alphaproteobacteria bacterium]|nr:hypothetical protein [Alphaproteobacteria bacterium]